MSKFLFLLVVLFSISSASRADEMQSLCEKPTSSQEIFTCSEIRLEESDKNLNENYKALNVYVDKAYAASPELREKLKIMIKNSQQLWIRLRDANCNIEAFTIEAQTQAFEATRNTCSARETEERSKYLENLKNYIL